MSFMKVGRSDTGRSDIGSSYCQYGTGPHPHSGLCLNN